VDGLVFRAGEFVMIEQPNAAMVKACAELIRKQAGERFFGLCIFRLPAANDATNLSLQEIASALHNRPESPEFDINLHSEFRIEGGLPYRHVIVRIVNERGGASWLGQDAFIVELRLPNGSLRSVETTPSIYCEALIARSSESAFDRAEPGAERRANLLRFKSMLWKPGAKAEAVIKVKGVAIDSLPARMTMRTADGKLWQEEKILFISKR
jgi:hypothetical protein